MKYKLKIRYIVLCTLLLVVWTTQLIPAMGKIYAHSVYPVIAYILSSFSRLIPFAIDDLFIALSIAGVLLYPAYARRFQKKKWKRILLNDIEYLLWIYVWFYLAWGLNYSQPNFYQRTKIPYTAYTPENFRNFVDDYVDKLNGSYVDVTTINKDLIRRETVRGYNQISDTLGVHHPFHKSPRVKTMLFTPLISMVGDLAASAIKRNFEIKDYGKLIPGHGGILDRFDSVIFTAPIIFYLTGNLLQLAI